MARPRNEATHQDPPSSPPPAERRVAGKGQGPPRNLDGATSHQDPGRPPVEKNEPQRLEKMNFLLRFAPWEEIWKQFSPQEVAEQLDALDLPESLHEAWRRWLSAVGVRDDI